MQTKEVLQSAPGRGSFQENDLGASGCLRHPEGVLPLTALTRSPFLSQCLACRTIWPPALLSYLTAQLPPPQVGSLHLELRTGNGHPLDPTTPNTPFTTELKRPEAFPISQTGPAPNLEMPAFIPHCLHCELNTQGSLESQHVHPVASCSHVSLSLTGQDSGLSSS